MIINNKQDKISIQFKQKINNSTIINKHKNKKYFYNNLTLPKDLYQYWKTINNKLETIQLLTIQEKLISNENPKITKQYYILTPVSEIVDDPNLSYFENLTTPNTTIIYDSETIIVKEHKDLRNNTINYITIPHTIDVSDVATITINPYILDPFTGIIGTCFINF